MPAAYSVSAMGAYPQIDQYFTDGDVPSVAGPTVFGRQLVVTTDILTKLNDLSYNAGDNVNPVLQPLAGTLSVWACVASGASGI
jgi:hypothetical protein